MPRGVPRGSEKITEEKPKSSKRDGFNQVLDYIEKELNLKPRSGSKEEGLKFIPSGSVIVDKVSGGGYPLGRITEIYGMESTGKSTLAIAACIEAAKMGLRSLYLDFEQSLHLGYAEQIGLDWNMTTVVQPTCLEEGSAITERAVKSGEFALVVIDSVAAMQPRDHLEGVVGETQIGLHARLTSQMISKLVGLLNEHQAAIIFINQVRSAIRMSRFDPGPTDYRTGGNALKFYESVRLRLRLLRKDEHEVFNRLTMKKEKIPICNIVEVYGEKNKCSTPYLKGEFAITYGLGVDNIRTVFEICKAAGIVKASANGFIEFEGLKSGKIKPIRGLYDALKFLRENPPILEELIGLLGWDYSITQQMTGLDDVQQLDVSNTGVLESSLEEE